MWTASTTGDICNGSTWKSEETAGEELHYIFGLVPDSWGNYSCTNGVCFLWPCTRARNEAIAGVYLFAINRVAIWSLQHHRWPAYNFSNHCIEHVLIKTRIVFSKLLPKIIFMESVFNVWELCLLQKSRKTFVLAGSVLEAFGTYDDLMSKMFLLHCQRLLTSLY